MIRIIHEENTRDLEKSVNEFLEKWPCGEVIGVQASIFNDDFYTMIFTPSKRGSCNPDICPDCRYNCANK